MLNQLMVAALTGVRQWYGMTDKYIRFYHTAAWKKARLATLISQHYLCQDCLREGKVAPAYTVHHIVPIRDDWSKRLNENNLEVICLEHHNQEHPEKGSSDKKYFKKEKVIKRRKDIFKFSSNKDDEKIFW